jgi:hypothetical protein
VFLNIFGHTDLFFWLLLPQFLAYKTTQNDPGGYWGLLTTFMLGLPVNGKCGRSAPDFTHMSCCMLLLSLTFSSSSKLMLHSPYDEILTFISMSLLYSQSEISLY